MHFMKKLLILAAAAALVLAASCTKNETVNNVPAEQHLIGFANYVPRSLSKAAKANYVEGATLIKDATFAVYAWSYGNTATFNPSEVPDFMAPAVVTYNDNTTDGETNTYSPVRYWPAGDAPDKLAFFSYYPENGAGITAPKNDRKEATGLGEFTFTAQSTAAEQVDFCVADLVPDQVYGATNASPKYPRTVKFLFHHMLTKVGVKFKAAAEYDGATIAITKAEFQGINNEGTLTAAYADGETTTTWDGRKGDATFAVKYPANLSTTASSVADADLFLMVPQVLDAQVLHVEWTVTMGDVVTKNAANLVLKNCKDASENAIDEWKKNNFITYTISIGLKPIWFTAEVGAWDDETVGTFDVE